MTPAIFDGHNDILLRLWLDGDSDGARFMRGRDDTHLDAPRARRGGFRGGFFAAFTPASRDGKAILSTEAISQVEAEQASRAMLSILNTMEASQPEVIRLCQSHADITAALASEAIAAIFHLEGAEAILPDGSNLDDWYGAGLRSIGPVWSRPNAFGHGVPLSFPGSPDQGPGLTDAGKALIAACDQKGIMIDLSHLNAAGFRDIARLTSRPLIATHSNAHALSPSPRNLTDDQLAAIAESGGLVGVNFASGFLRDDGRKTGKTGIDTVIRHLDALVEQLGENGVALGSDFDGAIIPGAIADCAGLPVLINAMQDAGYGRALIEKICSQNWLDQIKKQIG